MSDWNGSGLPPVGTVCEYRLSSFAPWFECEVMSHDLMVIHCPHLESDEDNGLQVVKNPASVEFRPIRTAEKVAAEAMADFVLKAFDRVASPYYKDVQAASAIYAAIRDGRIPGVKLEE